MSQNESTTAIEVVVERYFAMWNEADPARRRVAIAAAWTPDGRYLDPLYAADGAAALDALAAGAQAKFPGHRFRLLGGVDAHHDRARWAWDLIGPDGAAAVVVGVDYATLAPDGRLREVTGFFEAPAAGGER
jgi:hypothetical protein